MKDRQSIRVAIIVFDEVDLMDITGPKEVFSTVRIPSDKEVSDPVLQKYNSTQIIKVDYVAINSSNEYVVTADGSRILFDKNVDSIDPLQYDLLVVPGGKGVHYVKSLNILKEVITSFHQQGKYILSVCTGAYALAEAGIGKDQPITSHHRHKELFQEIYPSYQFDTENRVVDNGKVVICGGVTAGIDGAILILEKLYGVNQAQTSSDVLNYPRT